MKSYDLFSTLVVSRTGYNAGEVEIGEHIPVAENISKVQPEDIVISDYYDPRKAETILRSVCGLDNPIIVTEDGKAKGYVWDGLTIEKHLGDNVHTDFNSPRQHGIPAELTTLWQLTDIEKACGDLGWVMREARLMSWHADPVIRGLQLYQIERNFPFLLKAAHLIDAKMKAEGFSKLLLCSRDCYNLFQLMRRTMARRNEDAYEIEYFYTSRLTRYRPSESYAKYAKDKLSGKTLVVDMCGSGRSLKHLTYKFGGSPLLVVSGSNVVPSLIVAGLRETANLAPHAMFSDVDAQGHPVYLNPAGVDWQKPEITEPHKAFLLAVECLAAHQEVELTYSLQDALRAMDHPSLVPLWSDHFKDSQAAYDLLNAGPLPHPVIL
jgi:hypothetical protein